ncbi:MAG: MarR family winged helix-turn-helix transcriptional regulator [Bacillota bacterium]
MNQVQPTTMEMVRQKPMQPDGVLPLIQLISDLIARRFDRFLTANYGLTTPQYQLLLAAVQNQELTLGGLSEHLNCSRGNVTGIVDRLERDEWLKRERSRDDRRVITVQLTEKGRRVIEIERELSREMGSLSDVWDDAQRQELYESLVRIYQELKD